MNIAAILELPLSLIQQSPTAVNFLLENVLEISHCKMFLRLKNILDATFEEVSTKIAFARTFSDMVNFEGPDVVVADAYTKHLLEEWFEKAHLYNLFGYVKWFDNNLLLQMVSTKQSGWYGDIMPLQDAQTGLGITKAIANILIKGAIIFNDKLNYDNDLAFLYIKSSKCLCIVNFSLANKYGNKLFDKGMVDLTKTNQYRINSKGLEFLNDTCSHITEQLAELREEVLSQ